MQHTYHVSGMHCPSCELLIKQGIESLGCKVQSLSHKTGKLIVEQPNSVSQEDIASAVVDAGYTLGSTHKNAPWTIHEWVEKGAWLVVAVALIFVLFKVDFTALLPTYETISFPIALLVGLVASVSTCLALTGGIVLGYAESVQTRNNFFTQLQFHAGRIGAFVVGGAILGMVGGTLGASLWVSTVLMLLVWLILVYLGLQVLGFLPNISALGMHLPGRMSQSIFRFKDPRYAPVVGALTFLLPCGFTQSMQLFALQSGSPLSGALIMGAFAIGTAPVLFALWFGAKAIKDKVAVLNSLLAALLIAFGVFTLYNSTQLINAMSVSAPSIEQQDDSVKADAEVVEVGHNGRAFVPNTIKLAKGKNYIVRVTPSSNGIGCMQQVVLPGQGVQDIRKDLTFDIVVDGTQARKIPLVCSAMGMSQGQIIVE